MASNVNATTSLKAQEALRSVARSGGVGAQSKAAEKHLAGLGEEATEPVERDLCRVTLDTRGAVRSEAGRLAVAQAALTVLSHGVTGTLAGGLAAVALDVMGDKSTAPLQDKVQVGQRVLTEIAKANEGPLASTLTAMAPATIHRLDSNAAKASVARAMLTPLAGAVTGSIGGVVAAVGVQALLGIDDKETKNQSVAGAQFLQAVTDTGTAAQQAVSRVAMGAYTASDSNGARSAVAKAALTALADDGDAPAGRVLARVGREALSKTEAGDDKNRCAIGQRFLDGIARSSTDLGEVTVARVAASTSDRLDSYGARARVAQAALAALDAGLEGPLDGRLAQVGAAALSSLDAADVVNRATVASMFVGAVGDHASDDARRQGALDAMQRAGADAKYETKAQVLGEFLASAAQSAPQKPEVMAAVSPVAMEAAAPAVALDDASKATLEKVRDVARDAFLPALESRLDDALAKALADGRTPQPKEVAAEGFAASWPEIETALGAATLGNETIDAMPTDVRGQVLGREAMHAWAEGVPAPLRFGETWAEVAVTPSTVSGTDDADRQKRAQAIDKLAKVQLPADDRDKELLRHALDALPTQLLQELEKYKYTFTITRDRVSNAEHKLEGRMSATGSLTDMDEGAHLYQRGDNNSMRVVLRSRWENGQLRLDPDTFLRETGRVLDQFLYGNNPPSKSNSPLVNAFNAEHAALPARFHKAPDFVAEMFARYQLDPQRCSRQFPLTFAALEGGALGRHKVDPKLLSAMQKTPAPVVNVTGDPVADVRAFEDLNKVQQSKGLPILPYRIEIQGDAQHNVGALVEHLGRTLREARSPGIPLYRADEGIVRIPATTFNDPTALEKVLTEQAQNGRGAFLVLDELSQIKADSPGFTSLGKYVERFGGQTPLLLQGSAADLDRLREALPTAVQKRFSTQPLTAAMITELAAQKAESEGYELSAEARAALGAKAKDGELNQMYALWGGVKAAQTARTERMVPFLQKTPEAVRRVTAADVKNAKTSRDRDPMEELERLTGLGNAKRELRSVLAQVRVQKQQEEYGMTAERPRLNLLFEGNPGTGKTTVAKLFSDALTRVGYLKNNKFVEVRVQDLIGNRTPEENVKKLFEANKGGVIFIDEMHQLKDSPEGRLAFRAMIPYLGHPEYADTVFIGAGYKGEMRDLVRDIDAGAERRFTSVPFDDYSKEELGTILDKMAVDKQRTLDEPTREAALMRLERERRKMKNFGNAGSVASMLEVAIKKQTSRLSEREDTITKADLMGLVPDDFVAEKTLTPAEVWKEIDALEGLEELKASLRTLCSSIEYDKEMGNDPLESFEPYFILDGPPGTGKTTMARLIVKLMAAYDIIPSAGLTESQGADLQAGFIGQTTTKVQKLFESMWGQGGFIDEIGGLARAPEAFKADAAKTMLKQMEDNRGRFILVVADYADRVNEFLDIDPGIARRFGHRFSLQALTAEGAVRSFGKQLAGKDLTLNEEVAALVARRMEELHAAPDWASSGDVRKLLNTVVTQQKTAYLEARRSGRQVDPHELLPEAVNRGFDSLIKEKNAKGPSESIEDRIRKLLNG